uniref:Uncharacterized protein n=1 Tax=Arion vulgaris TaxID=1028688 RepID=A0A0B7AGQ3_9EUPU
MVCATICWGMITACCMELLTGIIDCVRDDTDGCDSCGGARCGKEGARIEPAGLKT